MAALVGFKPPQSRKRQLENDSESEGFESTGEVESEEDETPEEKRLRLAQIYLEELQRKEEENKSVSHEDVNNKLRQKELEESQKLVKFIADKFQSFGEISYHKDKLHNKSLTALAVSPDNSFLFTASKDGCIVKWNLNSHDQKRPKMAIRKKSAAKEKDGKNHRSIINTMAISYDGKFLATGDDSKQVYIWKCETFEFVKLFQGHRGPITGLAFARNRNVLYSCSKDSSVKTWDLDQMGYVETLFGHQDSVGCITSGISCDFFTGGSKDGTVRIWRTTDEVQLVFNHSQGGAIECVEKINAELFVTVSDKGQISLWSTRKKTPVCHKQSAHGNDEINGTPRWISALAILPCSDLIATGSNDGFLRLWKVNSKNKSITQVSQCEVKGFINDLTFTSDGSHIFAAIGQEHRLGRWSKISETKNQVLCIPLNYEDTTSENL